ncbi:MAG: 1-(5-phosphoribosyl)-5-[(5-phosphoribosylamino)methylideneamino]imidazole-4-carboxamide isomerase [Christensenellaceae bacterium]
MVILPAIDLIDAKAVRLFKGDYAQMTVFNPDPLAVANDFSACGAEAIHLVDLDGAKSGKSTNHKVIENIIKTTGLFAEVGGGIRDMETVKKFVDMGVGRVIIGTKAVTDENFLQSAVEKYGSKIAVGVDIKDGFVAIRGWVEQSQYDCFEFCEKLQKLGVSTVICTDVSKDGAMQGANFELYRQLKERFDMNIIASGGVSSIDDISALKELNIYGAIVGKAYYLGAIDLSQAIKVAKC